MSMTSEEYYQTQALTANPNKFKVMIFQKKAIYITSKYLKSNFSVSGGFGLAVNSVKEKVSRVFS